ncbi:hypothetical protein [Streptomyces albiflavescens]|uniref:hypothetical protein n=1 Tax=Streptomyces albiflavescens TaxID=1623582 RepID=UPI0016654DB4|nr:hypothetical protein [Streptomyces albiflavescens]
MTATVPVDVPTRPVRKALARLLGPRRQATPQTHGASAASGAMSDSAGPSAPYPVVSGQVDPAPPVPGPDAPELEPGPGAPDVWLAGLRLGS